MSTRREILATGLKTAGGLLVASNFGGFADALTISTPTDKLLHSLNDVSWKPVSVDHLAAAAEGLRLQGIPYRDLSQVAEIHGPGNWEFVPEEGNFAARLSDPNGNDIFAHLDPNTVAQGYKLLAEPDLPSGFREERIVVGPGVDGPQNMIRAKGILVRRDVFPDNHYTYVLTQSTNNTNEENRRNNAGIDGITVVGIGGIAGKGDLRTGFVGIPFGSLSEVARIYGGSPQDYDWLRDTNGNILEGTNAVRFNFEPRGHRHFILAADVSLKTVVEGKRLLWSPTSISEERVVASPGQYGIYLKDPVMRRDERPDVLYKYELGTKTANTAAENFRNGTSIQVLGINGFRGGEK